jgi:hypothetical protein
MNQTAVCTYRFALTLLLISQSPSASGDSRGDAADLLGYSDCTIRLANRLDDGKVDQAVLAHKLAAQCESAYQAWRQFMLRKSKTTALPTNFDMAFTTLTIERSRFHFLDQSGTPRGAK